ncbi:uncharacterized protein EAF02_007550 [Botrytis sinoallii]|uniref:uncharacterized protein n=1 Tax=Botrytis sinoallii TaxID=1463999 RepID=UPI0018FFC5D4|nr:uncharacterized protein EAF02_007550 [Botrytis sinoallii]KAF7879913.1 hypothetical protein EAF02_007550 [Botrytis sinoallii]
MDIWDQMVTATSDQDAVAAQKVGDMNYHNKTSMTVDAGQNLVASTDLDLAPSSQYDQKRIVPPEIVYKILDLLYKKHDMPTIWCILFPPKGKESASSTSQELDGRSISNHALRDHGYNRLGSFIPQHTRFLSRKVYGDTDAKERALCQRFEDYNNFIALLSSPGYRPALYSGLRIPDPTRKGTDWYEEMAKSLLICIIQNWDKGSGKPIGSWFEGRESPEYPARQRLWQEYMHSSLRAWAHYEGEEFGGTPPQNKVSRTESGQYNPPYSRKPNWTYNGCDNLHRGHYIQDGSSKDDVMQKIPDHNIFKWLMHYDGEDWILKAICFPKETSMKEVLRNFERDIEESWGPLD